MRRLNVGSFLMIGLLAASSSAQAAIITLNPVDLGSYNELGEHFSNNTNTITGNGGSGCPGGPRCTTFRNWFVFDLASLSGMTIVSATLSLTTAGYQSTDATETYTLFDASTSIASLIAGGTGLTGTFDDLGTGTTYGNRTYSAADAFLERDIMLVAAGVNALQAAIGGQFALGGALTTLSGSDQVENLFANADGGRSTHLILDVAPTTVPVPEPATLMLVGLGLAAVAARQRRRRHES
jgi:hypothetical protein